MSTDTGVCNNSSSENQIIDKRYRKLSYQLFGNPETLRDQRIKSPFVNLSGGDGFTQDYYLPADKANVKKGRRYESTGPLGRCLICYSVINRKDRRTVLGLDISDDETPSTVAAMTKEKCDSLLEFLSIIALSVPILQKPGNPGNTSTKVVYQNQVRRLSSRPWCLCVTCDAACNKLRLKYREMKALEREVKVFQAKFIAAIKLSRALAEKDPELRKNMNDDDNDDDQDKEDDSSTSSKLVDKRTRITLNMQTADKVRKCLLGGKSSWLVDVKPLLEFVDFGKKVNRNPEPLVLPNIQEIRRIPDKQIVPSDESQTTISSDKEVLNSLKRKRKPYGPRRKKISDAAVAMPSEYVTPTPVKQDLDACPPSAETSVNSSTSKTDTSTRASKPRGKRGPYGPRKKIKYDVIITRPTETPQSFPNVHVKPEVEEEAPKNSEEVCNITPLHFDEDNFDDYFEDTTSPDDIPDPLCLDGIVSTNQEAVITAGTDSSNANNSSPSEGPRRSNRGSHQPLDKKILDTETSEPPPPSVSSKIGKSETEGASNLIDDNIPSDFEEYDLADDANDPDFTPEDDHNSESAAPPNPTPEQSTSTSKEDLKVRERRLRYKQYYRNLRKTYPNMTFAEIQMHLRKIRPLANPFRRGIPGKRRRPISEIAERKGSLSYVNFRLTHGTIMSEPAYRIMRTEKLKSVQKVNEKGLPSRGNAGVAGLKANWKSRNGKLFHRGVEIKRNEKGEYMCPYCDRCAPAHNKGALAVHINRHHIDLSEAHECDQCDKKFYYHNDLMTHKKTKHDGGYQCDVCGANLANRSALFYHKKVKHEGIKPHVCDHCGKGFASRKDLTIHVRRHTGERPFVCHVCAETFVEKQSMKAHIRKKHPEAEPYPETKPGPTPKKSGKSSNKAGESAGTDTAAVTVKNDV